MPKLVGTLTQTQITAAAAFYLQPQSGKYSFLQKIVSCKLFGLLSMNIIDFCVEKVKDLGV